VSELHRLILAFRTASDAADAAMKALDSERQKRRQAIEKDLEAEGYISRLHDARIARGEADRAVAEERSRIALTGEGCPVPVGSKVVQWGRRDRWTKGPLVATGARGIVAVVTPTSDFDTSGHHSAGEFVIRLLKKRRPVFG
jgi:hypothetical protein